MKQENKINMKIRVLLIAAMAGLVMLQGCYHDHFRRNCVDATGPITAEVRATGDFSGIVQNIAGDMTISSGTVSEVTISAPQNILDRITTTIENGNLVIDVDGCINSSRRIAVSVVTPTLSAITLNGSGDVNMLDPFDNATFNATVNGSGNMLLLGTTVDQGLFINGSGSLNAYGLEADESNVNIAGSGNARVLVNNNLSVTISGSGSVFYRGNPDVTSSVSGSGSIINSN